VTVETYTVKKMKINAKFYTSNNIYEKKYVSRFPQKC